ncbi:MAG: glycosyltransferase family 2 protein [Kiritimatiellia bacterium]
MSITVIVPVYNASAYLRTGMDSLLAQRHGEWEAVCVDDGSTDGSGAILDEYAARDARIRVVHQANRGVSAARNRGLDLATGEIILFMDPDDLVGPEWMTALVKGIAGVDLAWGGFVADTEGCVVAHRCVDEGRVYPDGEGVRRRVWRAVFGYRLRDFVRFFLPGGLWKGCRRELAGVWCKAMRRSVIGELRFDERVGLYEDAMFLAAYARRAKSMRVIGDTGYRYFIRPGGLMATEARERMTQHKFELRDARREIDPRMSAWRGTFVLSALEVLRATKSLRLFARYVSFRQFVP